MNKAKPIITAHLLAVGTTLRGLVGDAVCWRKLPDGFRNQSKAVVLNRQGGAAGTELDVDTGVYAIRCYGGSSKEGDCDAVAEAVIERLRHEYNVRNSKGVIMRATVLDRSDSSDPDLDCPVSVILAEIETA